MYNVYKHVKLIEQHQYLGEVKPKIKRGLRRDYKKHTLKSLGMPNITVSVPSLCYRENQFLWNQIALELKMDLKNVYYLTRDWLEWEIYILEVWVITLKGSWLRSTCCTVLFFGTSVPFSRWFKQHTLRKASYP